MRMNDLTPSPGRKPGPTRQQLVHVLIHEQGQGDYVALAARTGMEPARVQRTVSQMCREGLIAPCATVPTGARPRNVYRAQVQEEPPHQFMARTLLEAWR